MFDVLHLLLLSVDARAILLGHRLLLNDKLWGFCLCCIGIAPRTLNFLFGFWLLRKVEPLTCRVQVIFYALVLLLDQGWGLMIMSKLWSAIYLIPSLILWLTILTLYHLHIPLFEFIDHSHHHVIWFGFRVNMKALYWYSYRCSRTSWHRSIHHSSLMIFSCGDSLLLLIHPLLLKLNLFIDHHLMMIRDAAHSTLAALFDPLWLYLRFRAGFILFLVFLRQVIHLAVALHIEHLLLLW